MFVSSNLEKLFDLITEKDLVFVESMLNKDPSLILMANIDDWGAIHVCAAKGNKDIMKLLIENFHADPNQRTAFNYTPLHLAARFHNFECLFELLKHRADSTLRSNLSIDVLGYLAETKPEIRDVIKYGFNDDYRLELKDENLIIKEGDKEYNINSILF